MTNAPCSYPSPARCCSPVDLSQIDARAVAAHSQDPGFMALFEDGRDFHTEVATRILGDPAKPEVARALNHSVNCGVGARKPASMASVPLRVAEGYLRRMTALPPMGRVEARRRRGCPLR